MFLMKKTLKDQSFKFRAKVGYIWTKMRPTRAATSRTPFETCYRGLHGGPRACK